MWCDFVNAEANIGVGAAVANAYLQIAAQAGIAAIPEVAISRSIISSSKVSAQVIA